MTHFKIGEIAGWHFRGQADLVVARHCTAGDRRGYFVGRKRLRAGIWEYDRWFEWLDEDKKNER